MATELFAKLIIKDSNKQQYNNIGMNRYYSSPSKPILNMVMCHYLNDLPDDTFLNTAFDFFNDMTEDEFRCWIISNC